jgi:hypothetical protein
LDHPSQGIFEVNPSHYHQKKKKKGWGELLIVISGQQVLRKKNVGDFLPVHRNDDSNEA